MRNPIPSWYLDVEKELARARSKFPDPSLLTTAFSEEAGELVKAILDNYHNQPSPRAEGLVYEEAIQSIAMAVRLIEEGDPVHRLESTVNPSPFKPNRQLVVVDLEELDDLNEAVNHARNYIASDRQEKREWKGWTLDEFDAACERLDAHKARREGGES